MADDRTVLLGMNSPQSEDPKFALWPWDAASTGGRLRDMLSDAAQRRGLPVVSSDDYVRSFDRRNLLDATVWDRPAAVTRALTLLDSLEGRRIVFVGAATWKCTGLRRADRPEWCRWTSTHWASEVKTWWCVIPHASGLTRQYNDREFRDRVGVLLLTEYLRGAVSSGDK